ncbi:hypothetical protein PAXRUDRAFT_785687 [Paxillus rubicundulus Ve08.2h10]|uniref:Uncharacterized protein n=1 Tax=Paxillus rubicundulus Ve08.2h10 TaxID=930991 RepID=A0A0D0DDN8_9AGAM|nr:hypothetical protein PAXRUDRAFT_785687 [Paxillus rubicundulus Ve08.2h10]
MENAPNNTERVSRLQSHLDSNISLKDDPKFTGLYGRPPRGQKRTLPMNPLDVDENVLPEPPSSRRRLNNMAPTSLHSSSHPDHTISTPFHAPPPTPSQMYMIPPTSYFPPAYTQAIAGPSRHPDQGPSRIHAPRHFLQPSHDELPAPASMRNYYTPLSPQTNRILHATPSLSSNSSRSYSYNLPYSTPSPSGSYHDFSRFAL